ncbi:MAG: sugar phosphate isomerase/epimerase [Bacteroidales bacterium]|jgi:sugar phosphate isomerase/epimerase|nr:sugar phosphate isomerase/epimerase [Bacteroidales bacterium]MDD3161137.1 sugar phosphate isomerase/epimerase [Bacteroidales bacterium]
MEKNRRNFIKSAAACTALASVGSYSLMAADGSQKAANKGGNKSVKLNLSFQEGTGIGSTLTEKLDYMEKLGIVGLEPGGGNLASRINEFDQALRGRSIHISAICAGFQGFLLAEDPAVRKQCMNTMKEILAAAGELKSKGVILVPGFNGQKPAMPHTQETRNFLIEELKELGEFALQHKTTLILEPLNRGEAFYLRQVGDAASMCRDANCEGLKCMGDFWHMTKEEVSDRGAFLSAGSRYLQHVHIASRKRRSMPGEDGVADDYVDGFKALKELNYQHDVSFECGSVGDKKVTVPAAVKLIREQWEKA